MGERDIRFNPYYFGSGIRGTLNLAHPLVNVGFQSLLFWKWHQRARCCGLIGVSSYGFNPYYFGSGIRGRQEPAEQRNISQIVSILIILEVASEVKDKYERYGDHLVSILIILEVASEDKGLYTKVGVDFAFQSLLFWKWHQRF